MGYLPAGGFSYLVTSKSLTINTLKHVITDFCKTYGDIQPFFDDEAMLRSAELWQEEIFEWTESYRKDFQMAEGFSGKDETLSHVKLAGVLVRAFTQCGYEGVEAASVNGVLPARTKNLVEAYPNEFLIFNAVYWLFHEQQFQRKDAILNYDPERPPMNPRYMRAITHYLASGGNGSSAETCRNSDLYLIFKTMDLFGISANYAA